MSDVKLTENGKAKGRLKIGALKLRRETLRELDEGELKQAQGGRGNPHSQLCTTERRCTIGCGSTRNC